jgi:mannose-1-phosphate guanylyltransferase/mannose-6-phosphate isomerase
MKIVPVILAGGVGERFWPLSRSFRPKQLLSLIDRRSMLEETLERVRPFCKGTVRPLIVTSRAIVAPIRRLLKGKYVCDIIAEPVGRNTAPAILMAALWIRRRHGPDAVMAVLPADHAVSPASAFAATMRVAAAIAARQGLLVIFGITPSRPDTGYGYILRGKKIAGVKHGFAVARFAEKPGLASARRYAASNAYYWNSGMFVWTAGTIIAEFAAHMPGLLRLGRAVEKAVFSQKSIDVYYRAAKPESVDYGIMEHSRRAAVLPAAFSWDDVGSWDSVGRLRPRTALGTAVSGGRVFERECRDSIIVNDSPLRVAAVGLDNIVLVATGDAVLAISREKLPDIKKYRREMQKTAGFSPRLF